MSGFQRQRDNEQKESTGWAWGIGIAAGVIGGLAAWATYTEHSYSSERHKHLQQCRAQFVQAHQLLHFGNLEVGDMIEFKRTHYQHWALYIGDGKVIHVNDKGMVVVDSLLTVGQGNTCRVNLLEAKADELGLSQRGSRREIVRYAMSKVGTSVDYHLYLRNCEHFVTECFYGTSFSVQQEILSNNATIKYLGMAGARTLPHD